MFTVIVLEQSLLQSTENPVNMVLVISIYEIYYSHTSTENDINLDSNDLTGTF